MKAYTKQITDAEYFASPEMSKHTLDDFVADPWGFFRRLRDGIHEDTDTAAFAFGRAVHTAVLTPDALADTIAVQPAEIKTRRGKEWDKFSAENAGKTILTGKDFDRMTNLAETLKECDLAQSILNISEERELAIFWTAQGFEDIPLKSKIDALSVADGVCDVVIDLKTCSDASPDAFLKSCDAFGYDIQAAFYMDACEALYGTRPKAFAFVCAESEYPFTPAVYTFDADSDFIKAGRYGYISALKQYRAFRDKEIPVPVGYTGHNLDLPPWSKRLRAIKGDAQ